jgi:uncharacterized Tic20 family protein
MNTNPDKKTQFTIDLRILIILECALVAVCVFNAIYSQDPTEQKGCMLGALVGSYLAFVLIIAQLVTTRKNK